MIDDQKKDQCSIGSSEAGWKCKAKTKYTHTLMRLWIHKILFVFIQERVSVNKYLVS